MRKGTVLGATGALPNKGTETGSTGHSAGLCAVVSTLPLPQPLREEWTVPGGPTTVSAVLRTAPPGLCKREGDLGSTAAGTWSVGLCLPVYSLDRLARDAARLVRTFGPPSPLSPPRGRHGVGLLAFKLTHSGAIAPALHWQGRGRRPRPLPASPCAASAPYPHQLPSRARGALVSCRPRLCVWRVGIAYISVAGVRAEPVQNLDLSLLGFRALISNYL